MKIQFSDVGMHLRFAPLTLTRPVAELRFGILTIAETWNKLLKPKNYGYVTEKYLQKKFPAIKDSDVLEIAGNIKPDKELADWVKKLKLGEYLIVNKVLIAQYGQKKKKIEKSKKNLLVIENLWQLFQLNDIAFNIDFKLLTANRKSQPIPKNVFVSDKKKIFIEKGASIKNAVINTDTGYVYIASKAEIMEGSLIRGPFSLGEESVVKMAAKIYGATTVGPHCKVGGEISNTIFQAYSNKGHDGFIGNSFVGEWCNFGADTNSSNLMNTYDFVKLYSYETKTLNKTDITFCGVIMGDHAKTGINTMFNTATSVGVSANIFGEGFPPKFIPSFAWGGINSNTKFKIDKALQVAENMMSRRNIELSKEDRDILNHLFGMAH